MKRCIFYLPFLFLTSCSLKPSIISSSSIFNTSFIIDNEDNLEDDIKDYEFENYKDGYLISKYNGDSTNLIFPSSYNKKKIIGIKDNVFSKDNKIENITLSDDMIYFSKNCFDHLKIKYSYDHNNLYLPSIENDFYLLVQYNNDDTIISLDTEVIFPNAIEQLNITSLSLPKNIKYINNNAISSCYFLEEISINSSNLIFNDKFIIDCKELKTIFSSKNVFSNDYLQNKKIKFLVSENITSNFDNLIFNVKEIKKEDDVFYFLSNDNMGYVYNIDSDATYINIKEKINFISGTYSISKIYQKGISSFNLETIILPSSIKEINDFSFYDCSNLININLPKYLNYLSKNAFFNCKKLRNIYIPIYTNKKNLFFDDLNINLYYATTYFNNNNNARSIHYDVKKLFKKDKVTYYIDNEDNLVLSDIEDDVESLKLNNYIIYDNKEYALTKIGNNAFYNHSNLKNITLSNNLLTIKTRAFLNCINLKYIYIPKNVINIEENVFLSNNILIEVEESIDNCKFSYNISNNKVNYSVKK